MCPYTEASPNRNPAAGKERVSAPRIVEALQYRAYETMRAPTL